MLQFCQCEALPFFILGKGSNTLFDDRGFNGLVILNCLDYCHQKEALFTVGAGFSFARLGNLTARLGYSGLEFAAGIPATCGGAIFMNAGAQGQEVSTCLQTVTYVNTMGEERLFKKEELELGYRTSSFQKMQGAISEATFLLHACSEAKERQKKAVEYRLMTQPYKNPSAGCAFRNTEQSSAGALIDSCGLKGLREGGALVSEKHANFIVNAGGATAVDVLLLIQKVKQQVFDKSGVHLETEIRYIPYE